ncbi:amidase family protein [Sandarakinorhabdus sp. AAP62]|uniref:amidase family protein n=1 Tax=Sandarakinorhabdus sp. AAP62 TaxID=1248916 RepID=UPI0002E1C46B|nr:amidase family protein [Sandarakinorhabdus sp. AAP62]
MDDTALCELSASAAVALMASGELTAEDYATALLARCGQGAHLNAFISLDVSQVLEQARAADAHRAAGRPLGLLHGLPVPVKDSVNTRDYPTTGGTNALREFRPATDAACVALLREAGAIVLGKTNLHELSFGWTSTNTAFGAVRNPHDPTRIPGGSSGGTAAAVAAGMAPLGVAEDTGGSIRVPAALCGLFGFRPTTGRYPSTGVVPMTALFDQVGPHARCMDDIMLFDAVMTGDASSIAPALLAGLRIGLCRDFHFAGLDAGVAAAVEDAIARLQAAGVVMVDVELPGLAALTDAACMPILFHDTLPSLADYLAMHDAPVSLAEVQAQVASPDVQAALSLCAQFNDGPDTGYVTARDMHRPALQRLLAACFVEHDIAALLFPTTMVTATPIGSDSMVTINGVDVPFATAIGRNILPGSTAGLPGLVMPCGRTGGLPVSIELDGPAGSDRQLLAIGMAVAALFPTVTAASLAGS